MAGFANKVGGFGWFRVVLASTTFQYVTGKIIKNGRDVFERGETLLQNWYNY